MSGLGDRGDRLADALERIAILIERHGGDMHYGRWALNDARSVRSGDLHGAEHFLSGFATIGDFNDLVLKDADADAEMRRLFEVAVEQAEYLVRTVDDSSSG